MLTAAEFNVLLSQVGSPVTFQQAKPPNTTIALNAIIQPISRSEEALINAFGLTGRSIQFAVSALGGIVPEKFDRVVVGGETFVLESVVPHHARGTGALTYYVGYSKGK